MDEQIEIIKPMKKQFKPYEGIVNVAFLNVREKPDFNANILTTIKLDRKYLIVEEKNGWGRLREPKGWVKLDFIKKNEKEEKE